LFITQAKKTQDRKWLSEVSIVPLRQLLNNLHRSGVSCSEQNGRSLLLTFGSSIDVVIFVTKPLSHSGV